MSPCTILLLIIVIYCVIGWFIGTIAYVFDKQASHPDDAIVIVFLWPFYILWKLIGVTLFLLTSKWINFLES